MHLIFDFDGTLVDSFLCVIEKFNILAVDFNFRKVSAEETAGLRNLSSKDLIKHLKIPIYKLPTVLYKARKQLQKEMPTLTPFSGISKMLNDLTGAGFSLGIVTSNSEENVVAWLNYHGLKQYFNFIHSESNYFGKKRVLNKVLKMKKIESAMYVGDETRDIEAAAQCGMSSIAVTWGFNSEKVLSQHSPNYIARVPEDILEIGLKYFHRG
jgi:phosphoglycolate phosphatase